MFKLFKNSKSKSNERFTESVRVAARLIESQAALAEGRLTHKHIFDVYSCGYMFGFVLAMLTEAGCEDEMQTKTLMAQTFMQIFGNDPGLKIMGSCLRTQMNSKFLRGRDLGTSEAMVWLASNGEDVPTGLTAHLSGS